MDPSGDCSGGEPMTLKWEHLSRMGKVTSAVAYDDRGAWVAEISREPVTHRYWPWFIFFADRFIRPRRPFRSLRIAKRVVLRRFRLHNGGYCDHRHL